jgi:hypothetical protein
MVLKKNTPIPNDNHIVRHIPWNKLCRDENDNVIGILGEAFKMRENEKYLSATLLEHFSGTQKEQIDLAIKEVRKYYNVKPKNGFAIGKVQNIKDVCIEKRNLKIRIVSFPTNTTALDGEPYKNESHVAVHSLPADDMELLELLATEAWSHLVLNSSVSI